MGMKVSWIVKGCLGLAGAICLTSLYPLAFLSAQPTVEPSFTQSFGALIPPPIPHNLHNTWTPALEAQFQQRSQQVIAQLSNLRSYGNAVGENEKSSYPRAMFDFLAGNREKAIAFLQSEDPQARNHAQTLGIDYYYCFTLKGQIRKYFMLGSFLDPQYRQRMKDGARAWTEQDPLTRPHPRYGTGDGSGRDWDVLRRGLWVDGRNTDNLRAMRETSVYLMAEETGNEATRQLYLKKIHRYVNTLYQIGMGEWDSEVYHGHSFAPYLNLYDFAKDPEVRRLAKAALDWFSTAAAVKYYRGGWGGPVKRDYGGGNQVLASSAARTFWLYFGDSPLSPEKPELDSLYLITSSYRPPLAAVALAHKQFPKPVELLSSKPFYENWKPGGDRAPGYWETQYFAQTYQMGSLAGTFADGDVAPFKLMAENTQRGVDYFVVNTGHEGIRPGKNQGDEIGQFRNLLIWLRPGSSVPFNFQLPRSAQIETIQKVTYIKLEKTYLALFPIRLQALALPSSIDPKFTQAYPQAQLLQARPQEAQTPYSGFALEVGDAGTYADVAAFKRAIQERSQLNLSQLAQGRVTLEGATGDRLQVQYNPKNLLPQVTKNGVLFRWQDQFAIYNSQTQTHAPISLGWKQGILKVQAGNYRFESRVKPLRF